MTHLELDGEFVGAKHEAGGEENSTLLLSDRFSALPLTPLDFLQELWGDDAEQERGLKGRDCFPRAPRTSPQGPQPPLSCLCIQEALTRFLKRAEQQFPGMLFSSGTVLLMISPVLSLPGSECKGAYLSRARYSEARQSMRELCGLPIVTGSKSLCPCWCWGLNSGSHIC